MTVETGQGYYEDRRPGSNIDAYLVSAIIADTTLCESKFQKEICDQYKVYAKEMGLAEVEDIE